MDLLTLESLLKTYMISALLGLVVLVIGLKLVNIIVSLINKTLEKKNVDESLKPFLCSVVSWTLKISVVLAAANTAGIKTTSFLAILGSAGLAVGLALQGSLANFAGGVLILLLKPFKVGDVITANGFTGSVEEISVFSTTLKTPDNQVIILPNGGLANSPIVNINREATRRADFVFGIGYNDDIDKAKSTLEKQLNSDQRVLKDPAYAILVSELADSSVNIIVRAWVNTSDYWGFHFDFIEQTKKSFDSEGLSFPYPQSEVHMNQVSH